MKSVICDPPRISFCKPETGLCDDCLREWLNRKPPEGTWRELEAEKLEERLRRDQADEQLEAGHA